MTGLLIISVSTFSGVINFIKVMRVEAWVCWVGGCGGAWVCGCGGAKRREFCAGKP